MEIADSYNLDMINISAKSFSLPVLNRFMGIGQKFTSFGYEWNVLRAC